MGVRAAWKALWSREGRGEAKASATGPVIVANAAPGQPRYTPVRYDRLAAEGFNANAVVHRCVTDIAQGIGALAWTLRRRRAADFLDTHPLLELLARPNPGSSGARLFEAVAAYYLLAGNSYLEGVGPAPDAAPRELWPLRPDRMRVIPGAQGLPQGFEYEANGRKARWAADPIAGRSPILHLKSFHPTDDWYGLSRIEAAARAIDGHNEAGAHNLALLQNGARPSGAVVFKPTDAAGHPAQLSEAQRREIAEQLEQRFQGPRNAGRPLFLEGDFNWLEMGLSPKDMDFLQLKALSAREIALAFGYPAYLLGLPEGATFSNVAEAKLALWEQTILPLADLIRDELANWLVPRFGDGLVLEHEQAYREAAAVLALAPEQPIVPSEFPFLEADIGVTALPGSGRSIETVREAAALIIGTRELSLQAVAAIRRRRLKAKSAIAAARTDEKAYIAYKAAWAGGL